MPEPIKYSAANIDLSPRVVKSTTVAASPALAAETAVCVTPAIGDVAPVVGVLLVGFGAVTVGASGTDTTWKIRRTNAAGTTVVSTGILSAPAAGELVAQSIVGFDTGPTLPGQVYALTLTVANGAAESTVSAATLAAIVV